MRHKFRFNEKEYTLDDENLLYFINDEDYELKGLDINKLLEILSKSKEVDFDKSYYDTRCEECEAGKEEKKKVFEFLEFYFYAYSKDGNFITSSIDTEYDQKSFTKLSRERIVDTSYLVTIIVCANCGKYSVEIEKFEV